MINCVKSKCKATFSCFLKNSRLFFFTIYLIIYSSKWRNEMIALKTCIHVKKSSCRTTLLPNLLNCYEKKRSRTKETQILKTSSFALFTMSDACITKSNLFQLLFFASRLFCIYFFFLNFFLIFFCAWFDFNF